MGEQADDLVRVAGVLALQPLGGPPVQPVRVSADERPVGGLLDQRVLEAVLGLRPAPLGADQVEPLQLVRARRARRRSRRHALEQRQPEPAPEHRRRREDLVDGGSSRSMRARITFSTVCGISTGDLVVEAPAVLVARRARRRRSASARAPRGRTGCPRPASRIRRSSVGGERARADQRVEQLALRVAGQRLQRELAGQVRVLARGELLAAPTTAWSRSSRCESTSSTAASSVSGSSRSASCTDVGSAQCRSSIAHDHRPVLGQPREQRADHLERPVLERLRARARRARAAASGSSVEAEHRAEVRVDLAGPRRRTAAPRGGAATTRTRSSGSSAADAEPLAQQVAERPVAAATRRRRRSGPRARPAPRLGRRRVEARSRARRAAGSCRCRPRR